MDIEAFIFGGTDTILTKDLRSAIKINLRRRTDVVQRITTILRTLGVEEDT